MSYLFNNEHFWFPYLSEQILLYYDQCSQSVIDSEIANDMRRFAAAQSVANQFKDDLHHFICNSPDRGHR